MTPERERARLFVALELPSDTRTSLVDWRARVLRGRSELRLIAPEGLHVTLCFLGWQWFDELESIVAACDVVCGERAAQLVIGQPLWLPPRRPAVLAVELGDHSGALERAQRLLTDALQAGGWYVPEKRPFLAHVTVARVRRGARVRDKELPAPPDETLRGSTVTLYRSRLGPAGARYEPLHSVELGATATA